MPTRAVESLLLVMADGVRPDLLHDALARGELPSVEALASRGGIHTVTTCFPSVTGPAYLPFLMGRHPATVGMPGLRWYDRSRSINLSIGNARSYSGVDIWRTHGDVHADVPTLFELAAPSLASMSMFARGASLGHVGRSMSWMIRSARPHFGGDPHAWRKMEQLATRQFLAEFARHRPRFSMLTLNTPDKFAHRWGTESVEYRNALLDIDAAVASAELLASRDGWRDRLAIWIVSDHGHAPVSQHDDLHGFIELRGHRVLAHPRLRTRSPKVALMVGGNAMAHVYLDPDRRERAWWPALQGEWQSLHDQLVQRPSVDLAAVATSDTRVRVTSATRGVAEIVRATRADRSRWSYVAMDGDPLELGGTLKDLDLDAAWHATMDTKRPDAIVQLAWLVPARRSGDIVLSAAADWDLRERFESVAHVSTHGALLRSQMLVPLVLDRPVARTPLRTLDVMPSVLRLLGEHADTAAVGTGFIG